MKKTDRYRTEIAMLVALVVLVWLWYFATSTYNAAKYFNTILVYFLLVSNFIGAVVLARKLFQEEHKHSSLLYLAAVLWLACTVVTAEALPNNLDNISVLRHNYIYWLALVSAFVTVCIIPLFGGTKDKEEPTQKRDTDDVRKHVLLARRIALAIVLCLLDIYTLYLLHEIAIIVDEETQALGTTFMKQWHQSVIIHPENEKRCDVVDSEMEVYGLIYHNQIVHNTTGSSDFECLFQMHEAVRLNMLCAVVAWTIYRLSTHQRSLHLLSTAMIFLALSTTVDDLRSYWVLGTEQAVFLTVALALELFSVCYPLLEDEKPFVDAGAKALHLSQGKASSDAFQEYQETSLFLPRDNSNDVVLNF